MKTQSLNSLIYNPIWLGHLLHYFLSGAATSNDKIKLELIYLLLPFMYDENLREKLSSCKVTSTFQTLFKETSLKNSLIGMNDKISSFENISNRSLLIIGNKASISSGSYIKLCEVLDYRKSPPALKKYFKAAYNLGVILGKEDYREVFLKIGASA